MNKRSKHYRGPNGETISSRLVLRKVIIEITFWSIIVMLLLSFDAQAQEPYTRHQLVCVDGYQTVMTAKSAFQLMGESNTPVLCDERLEEAKRKEELKRLLIKAYLNALSRHYSPEIIVDPD